VLTLTATRHFISLHYLPMPQYTLFLLEIKLNIGGDGSECILHVGETHPPASGLPGRPPKFRPLGQNLGAGPREGGPRTRAPGGTPPRTPPGPRGTPPGPPQTPTRGPQRGVPGPPKRPKNGLFWPRALPYQRLIKPAPAQNAFFLHFY